MVRERHLEVGTSVCVCVCVCVCVAGGGGGTGIQPPGGGALVLSMIVL